MCIEAAEVSGLPQAILAPRLGLTTPPVYATRTPLELKTTRAPFGPNALRRYARGVAWGLWLTEGHLAALGSRERVLSDAPVELVIARPTGLWLELTASPWDYSADALSRLAAYLEPILPSLEELQDADQPVRSRPKYGPAPTAADEYVDYAGPPLDFEWGDVEGVDVTLNLHFNRQLTAKAASALERAVLSWYAAGAGGRFAGGGLHDIRGPDWDAHTARWMVDMGHVDPDAALGDLARRLAAWSIAWKTPIRTMRVGYEDS